MRLKDHHRPLLRYRFISGLSCFALISAFVLFLFVALSLPIIRPIYLLSLKSGDVTELRLGVWGTCASSTSSRNTLCIGPQLGYDIPQPLVDYLGYPPIVIEAVERTLTLILILHPLSAGLVFIAAFCSLFLVSNAFAIFVLFLTVIAALAASLVLGIDLALVLVARNHLAQLEGFSFDIQFGNAVWMMVAACALVWFAIILLSARVCYCCGVGRHHHHHHHDHY